MRQVSGQSTPLARVRHEAVDPAGAGSTKPSTPLARVRYEVPDRTFGGYPFTEIFSTRRKHELGIVGHFP